jgi:hypothetical protein
MRSVVALGGVALVVACTTKTAVPGSFVVGIDPHLHPTVQLEVKVTVDGNVQTTRTIARPVPETPVEIPVDPDGNPSAQIVVDVEGYSNYALEGTTNPVISRIARTQFVAGKSVLLPIVLDARCTDSIIENGSGATLPAPNCVGSATCIDGKCAPPEVPPSALSPYTPTWAANDLCGSASPATLEVGAGNGAFVPLKDGDVVVPEQGAQGGYHVFLAFRAAGVRRNSSRITVKAVQVAGSGSLPSASWTFPLTPDGNGTCSVGAVRWVVSSTGSLVGIQGSAYDVTFAIDDGSNGTTLQRRLTL